MLFFYIQTINLLFAIGGLLLLAVTIGLFYDYIRNDSALYRRHFARWSWYIIIATTIGGVFTTLLYSEYFGFLPCSLCWLQRIALYAQALIAIPAWRLNDAHHFPVYGIVLSAFGFVTAVYQYIYQLVPAEVREGVLPCLADGAGDCGAKFMEVFGFVTFPFLSAVLFLFLITLFLHMRRV